MEFPTEEIELPSKGLLYPSENPLSSGKVEMKYMTTYHEDILTNQNFINQGTVFDKLLQSLIVSKINYSDLLLGDKNAILIAARVLGYGKDYTFEYKGQEVTVDLSKLEAKELDLNLITKGKNEFAFKLPKSGIDITFKLLTHGDEQKIETELKGLKKINPNNLPELSTKLKYMLLSVDGKTDNKTIREFVDNAFLAMDARSFRDHLRKISPDVDLSFIHESEDLQEKVDIPLGANFFWPEYKR